jgi:hypothetical protein
MSPYERGVRDMLAHSKARIRQFRLVSKPVPDSLDEVAENLLRLKAVSARVSKRRGISDYELTPGAK